MWDTRESAAPASREPPFSSDTRALPHRADQLPASPPLSPAREPHLRIKVKLFRKQFRSYPQPVASTLPRRIEKSDPTGIYHIPASSWFMWQWLCATALFVLSLPSACVQPR